MNESLMITTSRIIRRFDAAWRRIMRSFTGKPRLDDSVPDPTDQNPVPLMHTRQFRTSQDEKYNPYYVRGREDETNILLQNLSQAPSGVTLITSPPGGGKSTLRRLLVHLAQRRGYICINIPCQAYGDPYALCHRIREQALPTTQHGTEHMHEDSLQHQANSEAEGNIKILRFRRRRTENLTTRHAVQTFGPPDLTQTLRAVMRAHPTAPGILLHTEEFQRLDSMLLTRQQEERAPPEATATSSTIKDHFTVLNEGIKEETAPAIPVYTIVVGVPPAEETYKKALSRCTTEHAIHLRPIRDDAARQIMLDHLAAIDATNYGTNSANKVTVPDNLSQFIDTQVEKCEGYIALINSAAITMQRHYRDQNRCPQETIRADLDILHDAITTRRQQYYTDCLGPLDGMQQIVVDHLMLAAHHSPQRIFPWQAAYQIVTAAMESQGTNPEPDQVQQTLSELAHIGFIEPMVPSAAFIHMAKQTPTQSPTAPNFVPRLHAYCNIPLPSIRSYLHDEFTTKDADYRGQVEQRVNDILARFPHHGIPWAWYPTCFAHTVPKVPHTPYEKRPSITARTVPGHIVPLPQV